LILEHHIHSLLKNLWQNIIYLWVLWRHNFTLRFLKDNLATVKEHHSNRWTLGNLATVFFVVHILSFQ
jgi:hypothetical protein